MNYLFPYQQAILKDHSKFILWEKSRRIGGTFTMALYAVLYCLRTGHNCWFSSSDEKNALEFIRYVKGFSEVVNAILLKHWINVKDATTETVVLPNRSRINALSSNPRALRGKDGLIILDEFALHEDQEELYRAAHGCVAQRGSLILLSTHDGPATLFYRLIKEDNQWSKHRTTIVDACEDGYAERFATQFHHLLPDHKALNEQYIASLRVSALSRDAFAQEFLCEPVSLAALVSAEQYDKLIVDKDIPQGLDHSVRLNDLYVGIDVGRTTDLTVVWVVERLENPKSQYEWDRWDYRTRCIKSMTNLPMDTQFQAIKGILTHPDVAGIHVDQGTVGRALADLIMREFPQCTPVNFSQARKAEMAERTKGAIELQQVSLPSEPWIREDVLSVKRVITGKTQMSVGYEGQTKDSHADAFWSLSLALDAAAYGNATTIIRSH